MSSRLLSFSLGLNLVLLVVAGYWAGRSHAGGVASPVAGPIQHTEGSPALASPAPVAPPPLRWNELESEDYPTYVANLRRAGCPESVLRRIIRAELKELYAKKGFALVQEFHRDFWEIAA